MSATFEGRRSDSPYIDMIWRGRVERDYSPTCPADVRWNLLFTKRSGQVKVSVEGATDSAIYKNLFEDTEFLVIKFKLGVFMPYLPAGDLLNCDEVLPEAGGSQSFWMDGFSWQLPDFENVEAFVERLVREGVLVADPVVHAALHNQPLEVAERTVRRDWEKARLWLADVLRPPPGRR